MRPPPDSQSLALAPPHAPIRHAAQLQVDQMFKLNAGQLRSLAFREVNVREAFTLVDSAGTFFRASLKAASHTAGEALAYEQMAGSPESPARLTLVCAVLSRQRMLTVVQKATELGCVRIVPALSHHSVQPDQLAREKPWAWPGQALKASRQCRRASVPEVHEVTDLASALAAPYWIDATARFVLDDDPSYPDAARSLSRGAPEPADYALLVGPEGGWSERERASFRASSVTALRLGSRVLRAETAVYAGLSVLQHRLGDLGPG